MRPFVPVEATAVHFHDTYGQALANILASLEAGVRVVDASVAGLGGCPYAAGATGNVATEDVVFMLHGMGVRTGIDLNLLADAGAYISEQLGKRSNSRAGTAIRNWQTARAGMDSSEQTSPTLTLSPPPYTASMDTGHVPPRTL
jgi:hydroxymethylglutaryl-CoA lyase